MEAQVRVWGAEARQEVATEKNPLINYQNITECTLPHPNTCVLRETPSGALQRVLLRGQSGARTSLLHSLQRNEIQSELLYSRVGEPPGNLAVVPEKPGALGGRKIF